jgi:alanine-glyoxylate transaminase/serine-glyoxylate transaminase/serine-pyruvate transaminase
MQGMMMSHQAGRPFLQIPGPTNVPLAVLAEIAKPTIDHRGPEFGRPPPAPELGKPRS